MVGKKREMQARLEQHKERMAQWASQLPKGHAWPLAHHANSNSTCILRRPGPAAWLASLGLNVPAAMAGASMPSIGLEQLLAVNPAWLLVAHYREESIVKRWQQDPLWQMLTAAQKQQVASVDSNTWARMRGIFAAERIAADTVKIFHHQPLTVVKMTAIKHPVLLWGLPVAALIIIFWLSLFCYSAIPVSGADATRALLPGHTPTLPEALVQNLRLPRSLVAVLIGASLALAGTLLQTLTHNPMASPSLLGINSGAALAMALTSALSPTPIAGYSLSFIAACGGGVSWLLVMTAGGGFRHTHDRNKLILAGIALSAFCMGLTRITLLLAEDHAYGIFYWLAGGVSHARWQDVWQLLPVVVTAVPVVLLAGESTEPAQPQRQHRHTLGVNLTRLRLVINMLVLLLVGACVSVAGPVAFIGLLVPHLARFWAGFDQRNVLPVSMLLGATLMLLADVLARALAFPGDLPAGAVLALIGSPCFVWLVRRRG
ncbi:iron(III) dicitrate transport system, permease protein [Escherichia coli]|nr:iron(III) dicitrate transport system, permease protein [Escherichia coli]